MHDRLCAAKETDDSVAIKDIQDELKACRARAGLKNHPVANAQYSDSGRQSWAGPPIQPISLAPYFHSQGGGGGHAFHQPQQFPPHGAWVGQRGQGLYHPNTPTMFHGGGGCKVATGITDPRAEVVATQVAEVGGGEDPQAEEETPRAANVCVWARQPTTPLGSARRPHATNAARRATYNVAAPISSKSPSAHGSVGSFGRRIARE